MKVGYVKIVLVLGGEIDNGIKWRYLGYGLEVDVYIEFVEKRVRIVE